MIQSDNHVHTLFSADSNASVLSHLNAARKLHLTSLCFTDHIDYGSFIEETGEEFVFSPDEYFQTLTALQKETKDIDIRIGVELGLKNDIYENALSLTKSYPFDFVIGSTHVIDDFDPYYIDYWNHFGEDGGIQHFYETTLHNIQKGFDFDVYGHIDYVIRYAPTLKRAQKEGRSNDAFCQNVMKKQEEIIEEILKELISSGHGIEVNTGGFLAGLQHPNPHEQILTLYHDLGGEILSIGSDAHDAKNLGYAFQKLPALLTKCGFTYYTEFKNRKPVSIAIC